LLSASSPLLQWNALARELEMTRKLAVVLRGAQSAQFSRVIYQGREE